MRMRMAPALFLVLVVFSRDPWLTSRVFAESKPKAIKLGTMVNGTGKVFLNAVVVVKDDRIVSIESGNLATPPGAEVIDLTRFTGIPGLIDVHTRMTFYWDGATGTRPWHQLNERMPAVTVFLEGDGVQKDILRPDDRS
jgi:imidazolonepropionase-like amidohydrolase